jgi:hypothetical protein
MQSQKTRLPKLHPERHLSLSAVGQNIGSPAVSTEGGAERLELTRI